MASQRIYIGTYTERLPFVDGKAEGIYIYDLDMDSGELRKIGHTSGPRNPSYLALDPQRHGLYAVQETVVDDSPSVHAYAIEDKTLRKINEQPAHGGLPCHIVADSTGQWVISANYETGSVAVYPIKADGAVGEATTVIQHEGSSIDASRQEGPHAHAVVLSSDQRRLFVPDLGMDQIMIYGWDSTRGSLTPGDPPYVKTHLGAGPRHFVFHPSGCYAFSLSELDATIIVYAYKDGLLNPLQTISTLPKNTDASPSCAEIAVTPDGRFVYASNRGHNSIARFSFTEGILSTCGHTDTQGKTPRDFALDASGKFLIVGNQDSDTVVTFRINADTGDLERTGHVAIVPNPVCILFAGV